VEGSFDNPKNGDYKMEYEFKMLKTEFVDSDI